MKKAASFVIPSLSVLTVAVGPFAFGITLPMIPIFIVWTCVAIFLCILYKNISIKPVMAVLFIIFGNYYFHFRTDLWIDHIKKIKDKTIKMSGLVTDFTEADAQNKQSKYLITIHECSEQSLIGKKASLYIRGRHIPIMPGSIIICQALTIKDIPEKLRPYLMKDNIAISFYATPKNIKQKTHKQNSMTRFYKATTRLSHYIKRNLTAESADLFQLLFLGNKKYELGHSLLSSFKHWGVSHYVARSGMHLALLTLFWQYLFFLIPLPWIMRQLLLLFLTLFYFSFSWTSVSFLRALYCFLSIKLYSIIKKRSEFLHILSLTTWAMLLYNPILIFFLDFQLSFGMTYTLAWFSSITKARTNLKTIAE